MNDVVNIMAYEGYGALSSSTWNKLRAISPRMCKEHGTYSDYRDTSASEVLAFLRGCESIGLAIVGVGERNREQTVRIKLVRRYNQQDLDSAPFLQMFPEATHPFEFGRQGPDARVLFRGRDKPTSPIFERDTYEYGRVWMRADVLEKLRVATWKGVQFRGARWADRSGIERHPEWDGVKEVYSSVVLPPLVHEVVRSPGDGEYQGQLIQGVVEHALGMFDVGYDDFQPKYYEDELAALPPWDIACTYEYAYEKQQRDVFVSQRVYQIFKECNLTELCRWTPAAVVKGDRPKNVGLVRLEGRPPPKKFW